MKQIKLILSGVISLLFVFFIFSCKDEDALKDAPVVLFPTDALTVDLNTVSTPSIICVVNAAGGLKSVSMYIVRVDENGKEVEEELDRPVTSFYNPTTYSVNQPTSFSEDMVRFKLIAIDRAGQVTIAEQPIEVIPIVGLPEIYFSSDQDGLNKINTVTYVEDDPMSDIFVHVSSEEKLKYLVLSQTTGSGTSLINDTIRFSNDEKKAVANLKTWSNGETYVFDKGTTAIRAKVVAGDLLKGREATLGVTYKFAVSLTLNEDLSGYNGLPVGGTSSFSGTILSPNPLNRFIYRLMARDGSILQEDSPIRVGEDGAFRVDFEAGATLGAVHIEAENSAGKINSRVLDVHVGYKYYYLLASLANAKNTDFTSETGPVFSAELGGMFSFCGGKSQYKLMDAGFGIWNNNKNIKLSNLNIASKFDAGKGNCSPIGSSDDVWPDRNAYPLGKSVIAWADFDKAAITDFKSEPVVMETSEGTLLFKDMTTKPVPVGVAIYEASINGQYKKVLVAVDKLVKHDAKTPGNSTMMVKFKVEL